MKITIQIESSTIYRKRIESGQKHIVLVLMLSHYVTLLDRYDPDHPREVLYRFTVLPLILVKLDLT